MNDDFSICYGSIRQTLLMNINEALYKLLFI